MRTPRADLTTEQVAEAERIFQALHQASEDEHWRIAQLLASKPDAQLLGATEFGGVLGLLNEISPWYV
jgi:hypothetical protein